jgi:hypothetical protein
MKLLNCLPLSLTAALLVCLAPQFCAAQEMTSTSQSNASASAQLATDREAAQQMVPANAELTRTLNSQDDQRGATIEARLDGTVYLKNGTELPHGTMLIGHVTADRTMSDDASRVSLRFTEAKPKDGAAIPIEATIVDLSGPPELTENVATYDGPLPWNGRLLQFDDIGVMSHVNLLSRIGGANSATLVAANPRDMKLQMGSRMSLALGERNSD